MNAKTILCLAGAIWFLAIIASSGLPAGAFNSSSTNFFVRQDAESINGSSTSASFKIIGADATAVGVSTSTSSFRIEAGPLYFLFKLLRPKYEQLHFHWRNDDGTETTATSATSGNEDIGLANLSKSTVKRLRLLVSNEGGTVYGYSAQQFRIEYAPHGAGCSSASYTDVGAVGGDWDMGASLLTEGGDTTNIAVAIGGLTDENGTFLTPNGGQRETTSQTGSLNLSSDKFVELEYAIQALSAATDSGTYCFRLTNAGATTDFTYTRYATTTLAAGGNSPPSVSAVSLNHGNVITLNPNATTSIDVNFTVTDTDGCADVFTSGNATNTAFRSGIGATCSADNLNCYTTSAITNDCVSGSSANATATLAIYYFAQATDASSSYPTENWQAKVVVRDSASNVGSSTSSGVELNTLSAIEVTPSATNYGDVPSGGDTGSANQTSTVKNAGNSTTTLQVRASQTLTSGSNSISTSSQHYATSTFAFGGAEQALSDTLTTVSGFLLTSPTSTSAVQALTFWGLAVPGGTATGTYSGTNVFSAVFSP